MRTFPLQNARLRRIFQPQSSRSSCISLKKLVNSVDRRTTRAYFSNIRKFVGNKRANESTQTAELISVVKSKRILKCHRDKKNNRLQWRVASNCILIKWKFTLNRRKERNRMETNENILGWRLLSMACAGFDFFYSFSGHILTIDDTYTIRWKLWISKSLNVPLEMKISS